WLIIGGGGAGAGAAGGRGTTFSLGGPGCRRGSRTGGDTGSDGPCEGKAAVDGGTEGSIGGRSPRSIASSRRVSRSMVRTASQDESEVTSSIGVSESGVPAANSWISGRLVPEPNELLAKLRRTSVWSAIMS